MNAMMAAFNKAATKDQDLGKLLLDARIYHKQKTTSQLRNEAEAKKEADEEAMRIKEEQESEKKRIRDAAVEANKKKKIFSWVVAPVRYSMTCGIVFADNLDEATSMVEKNWNDAISIHVTECDCSNSSIEIGSYCE